MTTRIKEGSLELAFDAPAHRLDDPGRARPEGMKLVDIVVEQDVRILLVEIKNPSSPEIPKAHRASQRADFAKKIRGRELIAHDLVPKARDSYCFLHLMRQDKKPMIFVVLLGLSAYPDEAALLLGFKDHLLKRLRQETDQPWARRYVQDCVVLTEEQWSGVFPEYRLRRVPGAS